MLSVHIDNIGDVAVIACEGRIVRSEDAFALRQAVNLQADARIVVLDLSEVYAVAGGGLGMLVFLQRWAQDGGDLRHSCRSSCSSWRLPSFASTNPAGVAVS